MCDICMWYVYGVCGVVCLICICLICMHVCVMCMMCGVYVYALFLGSVIRRTFEIKLNLPLAGLG